MALHMEEDMAAVMVQGAVVMAVIMDDLVTIDSAKIKTPISLKDFFKIVICF